MDNLVLETFVLGDAEVKLTGRIATRVVGNKNHEIVEVTPIDRDQGTWRRWVSMGVLFKVN